MSAFISKLSRLKPNYFGLVSSEKKMEASNLGVEAGRDATKLQRDLWLITILKIWKITAEEPFTLETVKTGVIYRELQLCRSSKISPFLNELQPITRVH